MGLNLWLQPKDSGHMLTQKYTHFECEKKIWRKKNFKAENILREFGSANCTCPNTCTHGEG